MVLSCTDVEAMKAAVAAAAGCDIIVHGATAENFSDMSAIASGAKALLGVRADSIEALHELVEKLEAAGNKNLILDVTGATVKETYANAVQVRRAGSHRRSCSRRG